jgi:hypothetical protein
VVEGGSYNALVWHIGGCGPQEYYANMIFTCAGCTAQSADVSYTNVYRFTSNGVGFVPFSIVNDTLNEGPETFQIRIFKRGGAFLAASNLITIGASDDCTPATYSFSLTQQFGGAQDCPPTVRWGEQLVPAGPDCWARVTGYFDDVLLLNGPFSGNAWMAVLGGCPTARNYDYVFQPGGDFRLAAGNTNGGNVGYSATVTLTVNNPLP